MVWWRLCLGCGFASIGAVVGRAIADEKYPNRYTQKEVEGGDYFGWFSCPGYSIEVPNQDQIDGYNRVRLWGTSAGSLVSLGVSGLAASNIGKTASNPLPERFIGKSPEYVHVYNEVDSQNIQPLQNRALFWGSVLGSGIVLLSLLIAQE